MILSDALILPVSQLQTQQVMTARHETTQNRKRNAVWTYLFIYFTYYKKSLTQ